MAEQVKLEDSNMANYGSKEHKEQKQEAAKKEKAWKDVGKKKGLQIWRIEKFKVKHWPKDKYGEFYGGDSYIILHTKIDDEGKKSYDVFFWLGAETTQDEAGTAAYKTVELDDLLGDEPVQYREVQGNETKGFLDLFEKITILKGGVESGFNKVKPKEYQPRLLHVTGYKKNVQVYQVPIKAESLNDCDSFVLDAGLSVYQFNGSKSSAWEKRKANKTVEEITNSRHGKVKTKLVIDGIADKGNKEIDVFWKHFGGKPAKIADEEKTEEKKEDKKSKGGKKEAKSAHELALVQISDESGKMTAKTVSKGKLDKSKLKSDDAFIVDAGTQLFIWIGKGANKAEKKEAMVHAVKYLAQNNRPANIPMARVMEGKEPPAFWDAFKGKACGGRKAMGKKWKD